MCRSKLLGLTDDGQKPHHSLAACSLSMFHVQARAPVQQRSSRRDAKLLESRELNPLAALGEVYVLATWRRRRYGADVLTVARFVEAGTGDLEVVRAACLRVLEQLRLGANQAEALLTAEPRASTPRGRARRARMQPFRP